MSFDTTRTQTGHRKEYEVSTGHAIDEEGLLLVSVPEDGVEKVMASTGVDDSERLVGYAITDKTGIRTRPWMQDFVVPAAAPFEFDLRKSNLIQDFVRVRDLTAGADLTVIYPPAGPPIAGQVLVELNGHCTFNAAEAGHDMRAWFNYELTMQEAVSDMYSPGVRSVNNFAQDYFHSVNVGMGQVFLYTTHYDAEKDWDTAFAAGTVPQLGPNGRVTLGGGGSAIPNGLIIKPPTADDLFLGFRFSSPA